MTKWMNRKCRMSYALLNNNIFIYYKWATKMHCISKWISISFQIFSKLGIFQTNILTCQRVRTFHEKMTKTTIFTYFLLRKNILTSFIKRDFCLCVKKCPAYGPSSLISFFIFFLFFSDDWSEIWFLLGGKNVNQIHLTYPLTTLLVTDKDYE